MRFLRDLVQLRRSLRDLVDAGDELDKNASYELTASARRFSGRAKRVVEDKLSFSATLMRAGEVEAAHRLLAEVEHDVRTEEAALMEQVNEVKTVHTIQRERITRLRLARTLAAAMLGSSLLAFSAMGMAVAGFFQDDSNGGIAAPAGAASRRERAAARAEAKGLSGKLRKVRIAGRSVMLTEGELIVYRQIATGAVSATDAVELLSLLPPELAARVRRLVVAADAARKSAADAPEVIARAVEKAKKKKAEKKAEAAKPSPSPSSEPSPGDDGEPTPSNTSSGSPDESDDSDGDGGDGDGPLRLPDA